MTTLNMSRGEQKEMITDLTYLRELEAATQLPGGHITSIDMT